MDDFNFYMKLAKPLALNLPDAKDRTMAARWLKKLCQIDQLDVGSSDNIHVEYLKLLLFVMQANRLSGIFEKPPPDGDLQDILQTSTEQRKKAKDMIALTKGHRSSVSEGSKLIRNGNPTVRRSIGGDMCEYVAVQEIPNFGIHGYYALSTEPLPSWWNPPSLTPKISKSPCVKFTCENVSAEPPEDLQDLDKPIQDVAGEMKRKTVNDSSNKSERVSANRASLSCEKMKHGEKSLNKIFETQRNEMACVDTRPCWGRSRYIDRLIDESPHLVGDLDLSEADALLHVYRGKKLRKIKKSGMEESKACVLSSRRKQVEAKLDMPPCASIPVEADDSKDRIDASWGAEQTQTCYPREEPERQSCCTDSEDEDYDSIDPSITSELSISLRGGGGGGGNQFSSRFYNLVSEFQHNGAYETFCQEYTDHQQDDTIDMLERNDYQNWREDRAD